MEIERAIGSESEQYHRSTGCLATSGGPPTAATHQDGWCSNSSHEIGLEFHASYRVAGFKFYPA